VDCTTLTLTLTLTQVACTVELYDESLRLAAAALAPLPPTRASR
jgi:hypothetical protein